MQQFRIDNYYDGYHTSEINCIDLPIGAAAGHFGRDNYFYYCLCYAFVLNYRRYFKDDWFEIRRDILSLLDLEFCEVLVYDVSQLHDKIKQCFYDNTPIVLIVKYGALFYSQYYGYGTYDHGLLVSDYNEETKLYGIRDREVIREHIERGIFQSDVMHRLTITVEQLQTIWKHSQKLLKEENSCHYQKFYCIREKKNRGDVDFSKILQRLLFTEMKQRKNELERYLYESNDNQVKHRFAEKFEVEKVRRIFYRSFRTILKVMRRYFTQEEMQTTTFQMLEGTIEDIINTRTEILNQVQVYSARKTILEVKKIQQMVQVDNLKTDQFIQLLKSLVSTVDWIK